MDIIELANESGLTYYGMGKDRARFIYHLEAFANLVAAAARADERDFIATKWENLYGYDKQGVAEFIRKRANTQGEQHDRLSKQKESGTGQVGTDSAGACGVDARNRRSH